MRVARMGRVPHLYYKVSHLQITERWLLCKHIAGALLLHALMLRIRRYSIVRSGSLNWHEGSCKEVCVA